MMSKMDTRMRKEVLQRKLYTIALCMVTVVLLTAPVAQGAFFDTAGKSARAMAMGEVFLASSTDATSYWYNPAGLANFENRQLGIGYGQPVAVYSDLITSQINYVTPMGEGKGLGLGFAYKGIDVASDMVVSGAYGMSLGDKLAIGGNAKLLYWSIQGQKNEYGPGTDKDISKIAFSLDLSAIYEIGSLFGLDNVQTGVYVRDAIMPNISDSGDDGGQLPLEFGLGLKTEKNGLIVGGDYGMADGNSIFRLGAESPISGSNLTLRGGLIYESDFEDKPEKTDLDLGFGYSFKSLIFDYAYNIPFEMKETNGKHYVSFGFSF
jgi:hypothetical protein